MATMRVLLAGASGFLGRHLARRLSADGHEITRLVRRVPRDRTEVRWNPATGELDSGVLAGQDLVVNLAGANIGRPWTDGYKKTLIDSRVDTTSTLARALAGAPEQKRPSALVNASAVGWYGDRGDRPVTEEEPAGTGFFADLCRQWEAATAPAEEAGVRVVRLRTGLPLDARGGLLRPLLPLFRLGLGARLGDGRQYMAWIALADWLDAVAFLIERPDVDGPVNLTAPHPVSNAEFTETLGRVLHRPTLLVAPGWGMRLAAGDLGREILGSQRALPAVLTGSGFVFRYPDLEPALRAAVSG
jgi:uncharacterized protein (TIGR01777 family)